MIRALQPPWLRVFSLGQLFLCGQDESPTTVRNFQRQPRIDGRAEPNDRCGQTTAKDYEALQKMVREGGETKEHAQLKYAASQSGKIRLLSAGVWF